MSDLRDSRAETEAEAEKRGCVIVEPAPNQLFLDIDDVAGLARFEEAIKLLETFLPIRDSRATPSPSGEPGHFHIVVTLERTVADIERIAIQACLGSDLTRELLSIRRYMTGSEAPATIFFERKES